MSADAKVWPAAEGHYGWVGIHDGECERQKEHAAGDQLSTLLMSIELCMGQTLRWVPRRYGISDGLSGYRA